MQMKTELLKDRQDLTDWLENNKNNKDVSKKQRSETRKKLLSKEKEIEEIENQIADWRMWKQFRKENPDDGEPTINLLYKEPCYDF